MARSRPLRNRLKPSLLEVGQTGPTSGRKRTGDGSRIHGALGRAGVRGG
jgi:hypothetical protein